MAGERTGGRSREVALSVVWDERFLAYDLGPEHPFSERSRGLGVELLAARLGDVEDARWIRRVAPAHRGVLERFHDPGYLDLVERASGAEWPVLLDAGDTPSFPGCFEESARLVAGAESALRQTLDHRHPAFHPAGGLHHAHPDRASGFCIFNDVAIAVRTALDAGHRVAYIDIDAHHGDGVMYGFFDSGRVLAVDFHQDGRTLFPGTGFPSEVGRGDGAGLKVNVPLPPLAGDEALLPLFRRVVPTVLRSFRPDVIVLQHGVDGHAGDPLTQLQYTSAAYVEIVSRVRELAEELTRGRLLVTGGGGYRPESVARVLARAGLLLAGRPLPAPTDALPESWRDEFRRTAGVPPPLVWGEADPPHRSPWTPEREEKLVRELETALGVRLRVTEDAPGRGA